VSKWQAQISSFVQQVVLRVQIDLVDEGAESAVYTVRGEMNLDDYKKVLKMFRAGQPYIHDPFEERDVKTVFSKMSYDGTEGLYTFEFIEDIR
jgi:RIO-like serine/threonine protein kinase